MANNRFVFALSGRDTSTINLKVTLNPDATGDYIAYIKNNTTNAVKEVNLGRVDADTDGVQYATFYPLTPNTTYTFSGTLSVKWPGYDNYTTAGATIGDTSFETWASNPSNKKFTLSSDQRTLSTSWAQSVGGGSSQIKSTVRIRPEGSSTPVKTYTGTGITSHVFDVSDLSPGTYMVDIRSVNTSAESDWGVNEGYDTFGGDGFTITEQQIEPPEPEPTITGEISSVQATASGTSATIAWTWTPGSSFRTSEYLYDYTVVYKVHGASVGTQKYAESTSSTRGNNTPKNYSVTLSSLQAGATYDYWIQMSGKKSGGSESLIDTYGSASFSTSGTDVMTSPTVGSITETSARIAWKFTPGTSSTNYYRGHIEIGSGSSYAGVADTYSTAYQGNSGQISFSHTASGLTAGQKYSYRITMERGSSSSSTSPLSGSGFTKTGTFTTKSQAVSADGTISNVVVSFPSEPTTAALTWNWTPTLNEEYYYQGRVLVYNPDGSMKGSLSTSKLTSSGETISFQLNNISGLELNKSHEYEIRMFGGPSESELSNLQVTYSDSITPGGSGGGGTVDVSGGTMEITSVTDYVNGAEYFDSSTPRNVSVDVGVSWTNSTPIYMNVRVFYSTSNSVSNTNYVGYKDWNTTTKVTSEKTFDGIRIDGLNPEKKYYFKAYALTGSSYSDTSSLSVNSSLCSSVESIDRIAQLISYSTEPAINIIAGSNSISVSTQIKKANLYGATNQYKIVLFSFPRNSVTADLGATLTAARSSYGNKIIYESEPTTMTTSSDRMNVSTTIDSIPTGSYTCKFAVFYYDEDVSDWVISSYVDGSVTRNTYRKEVNFDITGVVATPTASWTTSPSIAQTPGATTIDYAAALTRNDAFSDSFRMRIRVANIVAGTDLVVGEETSVAEDGSLSIAGTTSNALPVGSYTFQFVAEWRKNSTDTWKQVYTSGGTALSTNIQKTISGAPVGEWTSTPIATRALNGNKATYACTFQRVDVNSEDYYMRLRIVDEGNNAVYTGAELRQAPNAQIIATGTTNELSVGTHSLTFIPEWRRDSTDTWNIVANNKGVSLLTTVPFDIPSSGGGEGGTTPDPITETIPLWSWSRSNNAQATAAQTKAAYDAITGQMEPSNFKHQVWNSLLYYLKDKIEMFGRTWWGSEKGSRYLDFNDAIMTSGTLDPISFTIIPGEYVLKSVSDGNNFEPYDGWSRTNYISVTPGSSISYKNNRTSSYNAWYTSSQEFISPFTVSVSDDGILTVPDNAAYVVFSNRDQNLAALELYSVSGVVDKTLTAKRFMSFTYNVLNLSAASGKSFTTEFRSKERVKGQPVYGSYFTEATDAINDLVTQINNDL